MQLGALLKAPSHLPYTIPVRLRARAQGLALYTHTARYKLMALFTRKCTSGTLKPSVLNPQPSKCIHAPRGHQRDPMG